MVKGGPYSFLNSISRGKDEGLVSCAFEETMVAQTLISPVHLSPMCERKVETMICITINPSPFEQVETYLVETMFYDQWAPSGEGSVSKPRGTFIPRWEDVRSDHELDLRELLSQKKKRKEALTVELDNTPQCVKV